MKILRLRSAAWLAVLLTFAGWSSASAETLLMPNRDFLAGTSEVVWGVTTLANGTAYTLDYGDGSAQSVGTVVDRSYIAFNHTYALAGTYAVTLTVGAEVANATVRVFSAGALSAYDLRNLNVNRAIQDGLRAMWVQQINRAANFPAGTQTYWNAGYNLTVASLAVLAFENQGYRLPNNDTAPTGIYEKYIVQRGMNFIFSNLGSQALNVQTGGNDPCVGVGIEAAPCTGYFNNYDGDTGYSTALASLALAGSSALNRTAGNFGPVNGKSYREVLQRIMNSVAWGQIDSGCSGTGGWTYNLYNNACTSADGSTIGWNMMALLDAGAAGVTIPAWVKTAFTTGALVGNTNNDGTFDYQSDANPASDYGPNLAKTGIGIQGQFYAGTAVGDAKITAAINSMNLRWPSGSIGGDSWQCGVTGGKGCSYPMFNVFKALKLYGIQTLAASTRPAGPGPIPASDWYAEYVDWLLANQASPTTTGGGYWQFTFSCCGLGGIPDATAIAELILSPVALINPDPQLFSTVGLLQGSPLSTNDLTGPVSSPHMVTAKVLAQNNVPVPGATLNFSVLSGPNSPKVTSDGVCAPVSCISDANGVVTWTYNGGPNVGTDAIRANIGNLNSNSVNKIWVVPSTKCDANNDGIVTQADLAIIRAANGQAATGPNDPRDGNSDGVINVADWRYCQLRLTPQ